MNFSGFILCSLSVMKKILVPTDLSPIAELGLKLAVDIAQRAGASVSLVNFTKHPFNKTFTAMGDLNTKLDDEADLFNIQLLHVNKQKLEALAVKYNKDVLIEFSIVDDEFKEGVDHYLTEEDVDLVVLGTSGEENIKEVFTGNHTEQVIKISKCPVISVRDGFNTKYFGNIVLAVNKIEEEMIVHGITSLRDIADFFDAKVHLVHVMHSVKDSTTDLVDYFKGIAEKSGLKKFTVNILEAHDYPEGIITFARQVNAGLIAVIKNSHDGVFRIFSPHFSNRLVKEVGSPVVTINA